MGIIRGEKPLIFPIIARSAGDQSFFDFLLQELLRNFIPSKDEKGWQLFRFFSFDGRQANFYYIRGKLFNNLYYFKNPKI